MRPQGGYPGQNNLNYFFGRAHLLLETPMVVAPVTKEMDQGPKLVTESESELEEPGMTIMIQ